MNDRPPASRNRRPVVAALELFRRHFALIFVLVVFLWSALAIISYRKAEMPPGTKIQLRIGHWQLEAGVRQAFDRMAEEYRRLHPEISIVQDAIPEGSYGTWLTTQLMGGTAPDMIELGLGLPYNVLLGYYNRYFMPLTSYVNAPNPYNRGTPLEGMPWRRTYKDGMRGSYVEELQQYMTVPLSQFGIRVFYNRDLLRKLTGLEEAPRDYRAFIRICETIRSRADERGLPYTPIASSGYHAGMWDGFMCQPLTYEAVRRVDFNRDGAVGSDELYVGFKTGRIGFDFPPFAARFRMLRQLTAQFQIGFTGLGRDEAVFLFAQQHAVFITTGTWDAGSLLEQARDVFEVGIMDFPAPAPDDPEFGAFMQGPVYERPFVGFPFAITRTCKHPEVALDFLRFLGSRGGNEELNQIIGWIPAIAGASVAPLVRAFEPHLEGVYGAMPVEGMGGETSIKWQQQFALFQVNQIDYEQMVAEFQPFYLARGVEELEEIHRNRRRAVAGDERFLAGFRERALAASGEEAASLWIKYRQMTASRMLNRNLGAALLQRRLEESGAINTAEPYAFSPEVIARVRAQMAAGGKKGH